MTRALAGGPVNGESPTDVVTGLDHVAVVSDRPADLFAAYERMGFRLSALSRHAGALQPGEAPVPWGTGNRCAMFEAGYLELLAIIEPELPCGVFPDLLRRYAGLHIVAFGCRTMSSIAERMRRAGIEVKGVVALERELETPEGPRNARFSLLRIDDVEAPEARINILTHHTPEYLWQPGLMKHPNGALALSSVLISVADVDEAARRYERILGIAPKTEAAVRRFVMGSGDFLLVSHDALESVRPGFVQRAVPQCVAVTIGVADPGQTRAYLDGAGVPFIEEDSWLVVTADAAMGASVIFERYRR